MKRSSPLRRKTPLRSGKRSTKYARRERDYDRMGWIKTRSCAVSVRCEWDLWYGAEPDQCNGDVEAHHAGTHGMGNKSPDDTAIPMCSHHHRCITGKPGGRGVFSGWPRGAVKRWELAVIRRYQELYSAYRLVVGLY
jgi:hypothetical protein